MKSQLSGSYTLSWTYSDHESNRFDGVTNPFNLADEWSFSASDQRHRAIINSVSQLPWNFQVATIFFVGSPRPINTRTNLDPFGSGDRPLARCHRSHHRPQQRAHARERLQARSPALEDRSRCRQSPAPGNLRGVQHPEHQEPDQLQRRVRLSTYLQPASSTDVFYQPRQLQFGFRVTY